jgi:hypothetical protein
MDPKQDNREMSVQPTVAEPQEMTE